MFSQSLVFSCTAACVKTLNADALRGHVYILQTKVLLYISIKKLETTPSPRHREKLKTN